MITTFGICHTWATLPWWVALAKNFHLCRQKKKRKNLKPQPERKTFRQKRRVALVGDNSQKTTSVTMRSVYILSNIMSAQVCWLAENKYVNCMHIINGLGLLVYIFVATLFRQTPVVSYPWMFHTQTIRTRDQTFRTHFQSVTFNPLVDSHSTSYDTKCLKQT